MRLKPSSLDLISPILNLPQDEKLSALTDVKKKYLNEELPVKGSHTLVIIRFDRLCGTVMGTKIDRIRVKWTEWTEVD